MTRLQFLLERKAWAAKWLATPPDQLPGTLTHETVFQIAVDTECELVDHERYNAYGHMTYAEEAA